MGSVAWSQGRPVKGVRPPPGAPGLGACLDLWLGVDSGAHECNPGALAAWLQPLGIPEAGRAGARVVEDCLNQGVFRGHVGFPRMRYREHGPPPSLTSEAREHEAGPELRRRPPRTFPAAFLLG